MAARQSIQERERIARGVQRVSVVGLGKLGFCLAVALADSGFTVTGVDVDRHKVEAMNKGESPIYEPGLEKLIALNHGSISATSDYGEAVAGTDATFVVVPTPSEASGGYSLDYVKPAISHLGDAISEKDGYHLVVMTSTVSPGSMDETVLPLLESKSGRKCGKALGLCYNPEFIALGNVIAGLQSPDVVIIGESDRLAGDKLAAIHSRLCAESPVERMSFLNAELAKIAVNAFVTMKVSFANTLAEICERLPGGDVDAITRAMGRDKRIGSRYLKGATGYGGPCFPRDNVAFASFAEGAGAYADLALATDRINQRQLARIVTMIERSLPRGSRRIGVLGVTYKPGTNVLEASQSMMVAEEMSRKGYEVHVYDPAIRPGQLSAAPRLRIEETVTGCIAASDVCVIGTPWETFAKIPASEFANKVVVDCWRLLARTKFGGSTKYVALGRGTTPRNHPRA